MFKIIINVPVVYMAWDNDFDFLGPEIATSKLVPFGPTKALIFMAQI